VTVAAPLVPMPQKGPIVMPTGGFDDLLAAFRARQTALLDQNRAQVKAQSKALLDLRETLAFPDLFTVADALCREADKEIKSGLGPQALDTADLAVALAPDLPETWWTEAHAQFAAAGFGGLGKSLTALVSAARAEASEPRYLRTLVGNLAASAVVAALIAGALTLALFLAMSLRYFLHDFHHVFPKAANLAQTSTLGVILLAVPWLFHLGPLVALAVLAAASWSYLQRGERTATLVALGIILAAPFLLGQIARWAVLSPLAEDLYTVESDLDSDLAKARLEGLAETKHPPYPVLAALAARAKRLGDYDTAAQIYRRALVDFPGRASAETNLGNVLFLQGDLEGAKTLYESAISHDPGVAAAYFDLGQAFNRLVLLERSQEAQHKALELDRGLIESHMQRRDELRANRYLIDVPLAWAEIASVGASETEEGVRRQVGARLLGPLAGEELPAAGALVVLLLVLSALGRRLRPCSQCAKCGRPVCGRCDVGLAGDGLCGQCVNVFIRRSASDPPARIRKEAKVRAYQAYRTTTVRTLAFLGGAGHLASGRPLIGALVAWSVAFFTLNAFWGDFLRSPTPGLTLLRIVLCLVLLSPIYLFSVRDVFVER
jgi:tetratricopeptide (TPR) repeat protein